MGNCSVGAGRRIDARVKTDTISHRNHCVAASERRLLRLRGDRREGCEENQCDERAR